MRTSIKYKITSNKSIPTLLSCHKIMLKLNWNFLKRWSFKSKSMAQKLLSSINHSMKYAPLIGIWIHSFQPSKLSKLIMIKCGKLLIRDLWMTSSKQWNWCNSWIIHWNSHKVSSANLLNLCNWLVDTKIENWKNCVNYFQIHILNPILGKLSI